MTDETDRVRRLATRTQQIEYGFLVDVSELAQETGFQHPLALSRAVWDVCVARHDEGAPTRGWRKRLQNILATLVRITPSESDAVTFDAGSKRAPMELRAVYGRGDAAEPVITVMLPGEDWLKAPRGTDQA